MVGILQMEEYPSKTDRIKIEFVIKTSSIKSNGKNIQNHNMNLLKAGEICREDDIKLQNCSSKQQHSPSQGPVGGG